MTDEQSECSDVENNFSSPRHKSDERNNSSKESSIYGSNRLINEIKEEKIEES